MVNPFRVNPSFGSPIFIIMISVFDIHRQNEEIGRELDEAIKRVIDSGIFILGKEVAVFEEEFAHYIGIKYAVGVASGTDAITLALLSLGIGLGDEVIVPANCYPSVFGVAAAGCEIKLVDIDPSTHTLDTAQLERCISKKTKAILAVHLYGQPADLDRIQKIAKKYKLFVIEDCAQAHGAEIKINNPINTNNPITQWKKVGTIGDVGCFSFYPTKNLGCFGDGGMVVTNNEEIEKKVRLLRMYGEESRYHSVIVGRNSRLDEMQAAILRVKLKHLDKWNKRRREKAKKYNENFAEVGLRFFPHPSGLRSSGQASHSRVYPERSRRAQKGSPSPQNFHFTLPYETEYAKHIYHLYVIRAKKRNELKKYLERQGIGTGIHYPVPIHLVPSFAYLGYQKGDFPESEKASNEVLSLPMFPELKEEEVMKVCTAVMDFLHETSQ